MTPLNLIALIQSVLKYGLAFIFVPASPLR